MVRAAPGSVADPVRDDVVDDPSPDLPTAWLAGIVAVLVAGAAWGIDRPLWLDESYSLGALHEPMRAAVVDRGSMLGFHALLWPLSLVSEAPWVLRLPSLVASCAAVALLVRSVAADHGRRVAVAAGLYLATAWPVVSHAQEARAYALGLLVVVGQWHVLRRWVHTGERRWIRWWTVLAVGATFVHGLAVLQVLAQVAVVELAGFDRPARRPIRLGAAVAAVPPAVLAVAGATTLTPYQPPLTLDTVVVLVEDLAGPGLLGLPVLALAGLGAAQLVRTARRSRTAPERFTALVPLAWAIVPVVGLCAVSLATPKMFPRYAFTSIAGLAVLVGVGVSALPTRRLAIGAIAAVVALLGVHQVQAHQAGSGDWRGAAAIVATEARPGDAVVFPRANRRPPFEVEWGRRDDAPDIEVINPTRPFGEIRWLEEDAPLPTVVEQAVEHPRVWVVTEPFGSVDRERPFAEALEEAGYRRVDRDDLGKGIAVDLYERR